MEPPDWLADVEAVEAPDLEVDWAALPDDWRDRRPAVHYRDEDNRSRANRIRALIVEGLVGPPAFTPRFADWVERGILD